MINCTFEDNGKGSLRHVTVVAIVVNKENQFLLIKRASHLPRGNTYTIPGGFLDRDETLEEGMLRELKEESGLSATSYFLFRINSNPDRLNEDRQNVDFIYVVDKFEGDLKTGKETTGIQWFDEVQLPPQEDFAYDHRESIMRYIQYKKKQYQLPIVE